MEGTNPLWLRDYAKRRIRLTEERWTHILEHQEMLRQLPKVRATLRAPALVLKSRLDPSVHLHFRLYQRTPVGRKYLMVAVKYGDMDAFVVTAFFTDQPRGATQVWPA